MKPEALLEPLSEDAPCGPDLNAEMDPEYDEYYFGALGRLPSFFVQPGVQRPDGTHTPDRYFDAASVDHRAEAEAIDSLLSRCRDIRLLVLRAQWEALAGRLTPMAEAIEGIALLLETHGESVHPTLADGPADRRDALADLNQPIMMVQPLQFMNLTGAGEVSLRKIRVANGQGTPLQDEEDLNASALSDTLSDSSNRKRVDESHVALLKMADCFGRIEKSCQTNPQTPFSPGIGDVKQTVLDMLDAINQARPDLRGADVQTAAIEEAAEAEAAPVDGDGPVAAAPVAAAAPKTDVKSHTHARALLEACEHYYRRAEPSSAALLLVTQARLLIGKPLIEALETLLPAQAGRAVVDFGPQTGFSLNIDRLRQLSAAMPEAPAPAPPTEEPPVTVPPIADAAGAAATLRSVEDYFRLSERSSPVPILLQRARSYLDRDFQSLVDELIPDETPA